MRDEKRQKNKEPVNEKPKSVPIVTSANQETEQGEDERLTYKYPANPNNTSPNPLYRVLIKPSAECIGVIVAIMALIATGYNTYLTRQALHTSQRAFVYCKEVNIISYLTTAGKPNPTTPALVTILLRNSSETPAKKTNVNVNYCFRKGDLPNNFSYPASTVKRPIMMIAPNSEVTLTMPLPNNVFNNLEGNNLLIYGNISYLDIFGIKHTLHFCEKYVAKRMNLQDSSIKYFFGPCGTHSCYDEDCPEQWGNNPDCTSPN